MRSAKIKMRTECLICRDIKQAYRRLTVSLEFYGLFSIISFLATVNIDASTAGTEIGYNSFYNCIRLEDVYYGGNEQQWNSISIHNNNDDLISATIRYLAELTFTVTATAGENGTISPSGEVSVLSDEKKTFNILPDYGYVVKDVLVNGASVGTVESYTFSNLTDNATITAEFAKVDAAYENGTVTISSETALKDLKLIVATYDTDGRLTDCKIKTVTTNASEGYQDTIAEAENMKLKLWSGLDTKCPIWCNK